MRVFQSFKEHISRLSRSGSLRQTSLCTSTTTASPDSTTYWATPYTPSDSAQCVLEHTYAEPSGAGRLWDQLDSSSAGTTSQSKTSGFEELDGTPSPTSRDTSDRSQTDPTYLSLPSSLITSEVSLTGGASFSSNPNQTSRSRSLQLSDISEISQDRSPSAAGFMNSTPLFVTFKSEAKDFDEETAEYQPIESLFKPDEPPSKRRRSSTVHIPTLASISECPELEYQVRKKVRSSQRPSVDGATGIGTPEFTDDGVFESDLEYSTKDISFVIQNSTADSDHLEEQQQGVGKTSRAVKFGQNGSFRVIQNLSAVSLPGREVQRDSGSSERPRPLRLQELQASSSGSRMRSQRSKSETQMAKPARTPVFLSPIKSHKQHGRKGVDGPGKPGSSQFATHRHTSPPNIGRAFCIVQSPVQAKDSFHQSVSEVGHATELMVTQGDKNEPLPEAADDQEVQATTNEEHRSDSASTVRTAESENQILQQGTKKSHGLSKLTVSLPESKDFPKPNAGHLQISGDGASLTFMDSESESSFSRGGPSQLNQGQLWESPLLRLSYTDMDSTVGSAPGLNETVNSGHSSVAAGDQQEARQTGVFSFRGLHSRPIQVAAEIEPLPSHYRDTSDTIAVSDTTSSSSSFNAEKSYPRSRSSFASSELSASSSQTHTASRSEQGSSDHTYESIPSFSVVVTSPENPKQTTPWNKDQWKAPVFSPPKEPIGFLAVPKQIGKSKKSVVRKGRSKKSESSHHGAPQAKQRLKPRGKMAAQQCQHHGSFESFQRDSSRSRYEASGFAFAKATIQDGDTGESKETHC